MTEPNKLILEISEIIGWNSQDLDFYLRYDFRTRPRTGSGKDGKKIYERLLELLKRRTVTNG